MRMVDALKAVESYLNLVIVRNRFDIMIRRQLATEEVMHAARRVIGRGRRGAKTEEQRIMRIRKYQVEKELRRAWYEWRYKTELLKPVLRSKRTFSKFRHVEEEFRQYVWREGVRNSKAKVEFALEKRRRESMRRRSTRREQGHQRSYLVTDEELLAHGKLEEKKNYEVYGDVQLTDGEVRCLELGPKYMVTPALKREDFEVEVEIESVKTRLELKEREEVMEENGDVDDKDLEWRRDQERERRQIFDREHKTLEMRKLKVTDAKYNVRSFFPRAAASKEESRLQLRREEMMNTFDKYVQTKCTKKGEQKNRNMTMEQLQGRDSLIKRVKEGEIVVTTTDKSGKFAVVETSLYKEGAKEHLKDEEISIEEVKATEVMMNRHSQQIVTAFKMGTFHGKHGQEVRVGQAFRSVGAQPGPVQFLVKDHKGTPQGKEMPPMRQVCSAKGGPSSRLSNLVSTILNKTADSLNSATECQSTEELQREILEANIRIEERCKRDPEFREKMKRAEVISIDVKALYPSLKIEEVKKIIREMVVRAQDEGKVSFEEVDFHEVGKYLAIACTREEINNNRLSEVVPKKTANNRGPTPGPAYWEDDLRDTYVDGKKTRVPKWEKAREPTKQEGHKMIALMIQKAVETVMGNHTYRFDGRIYKQKDGGPIGDEMSQAVARLTMIWFDERFLEKCTDEGMEIEFYKRYVDDSNMLAIPPEEEEEEGRNMMRNMREGRDKMREGNGKKVAARCREIADRVCRMLKFEEDVGENYEDGKLPILDLKVWLEKKKGFRIMHEFYKKPMATRYTLRKGTAYPKEKIRAVLVEEVMRRLRNCSPELSEERKGEFLTEYAKEMQNSGHDEALRKEVMERALWKYEKELLEHRNGRKKLYRNREERERLREERGGKNSKDSWFRRKKKGEKAATSVMRVPFTGGVLKDWIDKGIKASPAPEGTRTVAQEEGGDKLKDMLVRPDPFPRPECNRADCQTVTSGKRGRQEQCKNTCWQQHVNYTVTCVKCNEKAEKGEGKQHVYIGESSRGCHTRFKQELDEYNPKDKGFMYMHALKEHGGSREVAFKIQRHSIDSDPMRRILREGIRIERARKDGTKVVMNSKNEHFGPQTVRGTYGTDWDEDI